MSTTLRPFQIVLLAVFAVFAVVAIFLLTKYQADRTEEANLYGQRVEIWGTQPRSAFNGVFDTISRSDKAFNAVTYTQISPSSFENDLVNAIAEGRSPDLIVLPSELLITLRSKLYPISYNTYSRRDFQDRFIDGAEIFALSNGIYALPFAIDPLMMYWNRDMFLTNGLPSAPTTWESIVSSVVPSLTIRDFNRNVQQSGVAFGEFRNVTHAKEILMLLALQSGSKMVLENDRGYQVQIDVPVTSGVRAPLQSTLQFFTDFSNVNSPLYSWNRAMPIDKNAFTSGDLGLYFGMGSEVYDIENRNPNLNFDIAPVPQGSGATIYRTYGDFYGFAIPRASKNVSGAYAVANILTTAQNGQALALALGMSSARRDVIAAGESGLYRQVIVQAALIARGWLDPNPVRSDQIFMQMVEDIVSNRERVDTAVRDAISRLILAY